MDELIVTLMKDMGINDSFIKNPATYEIIKHYVRIKLKDMYSQHLLVDAKENEDCTLQEISDGLKRENSKLVYWDNIINTFEIPMLKYYKSQMSDPVKKRELVKNVKLNIRILERSIRIRKDENKIYITYKTPCEKENIFMFYNQFNGNVLVERTLQINEEEQISEKSFKVLYEKYNSQGEQIDFSVRDFGNKMEQQEIKKRVNKLRKKYYSEVLTKLDNLKNKNKARLDKVIGIISNRLKIEQMEDSYFGKTLDNKGKNIDKENENEL